jgi:flagellar biosynthesis/type III secretory pathway M-ring protein FliF/YscJ
MAAAMQLYASFTLLVIAILVIIAFAAVVSNLMRSVRRRFGWARARAHDDFAPPTAPSHPPASRKKTPPAARSHRPPAPR